VVSGISKGWYGQRVASSARAGISTSKIGKGWQQQGLLGISSSQGWQHTGSMHEQGLVAAARNGNSSRAGISKGVAVSGGISKGRQQQQAIRWCTLPGARSGRVAAAKGGNGKGWYTQGVLNTRGV
jgi:hypothetical protein